MKTTEGDANIVLAKGPAKVDGINITHKCSLCANHEEESCVS